MMGILSCSRIIGNIIELNNHTSYCFDSHAAGLRLRLREMQKIIYSIEKLNKPNI